MRNAILSAVLAVFGASSVAAQTGPDLAQVGLQSRIDALAQNPERHGFELGMLSALRGIEKTFQTRYEYGLGDRLMALPMLRVQLGPRNPAPKTFAPDTLSQMMRVVLQDMETAREHLDQASQNGAIEPFTLTLQDVWFDVNTNNLRDDGEDAIEALAPFLLGRQALRAMSDEVLQSPLTVRFDAADHAWLSAYTQMVSGFGSLFLAFDPAPVLQDLADKRAALATAPEILNIFDPEELAARIDALEQEQVVLDEQLAALRDRERRLKDLAKTLREANPDADHSRMNAEINRIRSLEINPLREQQRIIRAEISAANAKLTRGGASQFNTFRNDVDALYVLLATLRQEPDKAHVAAAHAHWLAMIAQNKVFWAALNQETDNDREWIPNPQQTSALPLAVDADMAEGWQAILKDAEDLLEGRLLLPHPLLPSGTGINLKAFAEDPGPLDLINWVHGIGAYPYAAKGPLITRQRWLAFQRLTRGNAAGFALFFN